jgi:hypothetical protein
MIEGRASQPRLIGNEPAELTKRPVGEAVLVGHGAP